MNYKLMNYKLIMFMVAMLILLAEAVTEYREREQAIAQKQERFSQDVERYQEAEPPIRASGLQRSMK